MQEEIRKEILTRDIVKKDVKSILIYNIFMYLLYCLLFLLLLLTFYWLFLLSDVSRQTLNTIFSIIAVLVCIPFGLVAIRCIKMLLRLKNNRFDVVIDKIYDKKFKTNGLGFKDSPPVSKPLLSFYPFTSLYCLCFNKYKNYDVSHGYHYNFSKINKMNQLQQFQSTEIGDEFYLFVMHEKIIEIYNTKIFELKD